MEVLKHWGMGSVVQRSAPAVVNNSSAALGRLSPGVPTVGQVTLFLLWLTTVFLWMFRLVSHRRRSFLAAADDSDLEAEVHMATDDRPRGEDDATSDSNGKNGPPRKNAQTAGHQDGVITSASTTVIIPHSKVEGSPNNNTDVDAESNMPNGRANTGFGGVKAPLSTARDAAPGKTLEGHAKTPAATTFSKVKPPPSFDEFLICCAKLGLIMLFFFMCDYKHEWPEGQRQYSRDLFMFLVLLLFAVAGVFTVQTTEDKILNRDQTEEWKGWMQVMFVWYHYYKAVETYNYIRIFIACYVWMTGFGNFSFFWVRQDFSLWRLLKMLFRLNFLVILAALVTDNSYMLYYICAMHTYWFLSVYTFMAVLPSWNQSRPRMAIKFVCYFAVNALIFETPAREVVFRPLWFVLAYQGSLHEWLFRAGLDHYATFVGMLCAYNYPYYERFMNYLDKKHLNRGDYLSTVYIKLFLCGLIAVAVAIWYDGVAIREKYDYNTYHPYTSWLPILAYIFLRNMFPALRKRYLGLFAFLGKITLETYIAQLHIYMQFGAKQLIVFIPGYPMMNFALASTIYLFLSYQLFHLTVECSSFLLPKNMKRVLINAILAAVVIGLHVCFALLCREIGIV